MTQDFYDGPPRDAWAIAARSPQGEYGVALGHGPQQIGFLVEAQIEAFIAAARKVGERPALLALVVAARATLPAFKADLARRQARRRAALNN